MFTNICIMAHAKAALLKNRVANFFKDERGEVNIIAIIVVLAIALALAVIFKNQISSIFDRIWDGIWGSMEDTPYEPNSKYN